MICVKYLPFRFFEDQVVQQSYREFAKQYGADLTVKPPDFVTGMTISDDIAELARRYVVEV
jgi:hypothetical protein